MLCSKKRPTFPQFTLMQLRISIIDYGYPFAALLVIGLQLWISIIELWISIIQLLSNIIMDIHNSIMDIHNSIMDILNSITDIHNSITDIHNSIMVIHNYMLAIIELWKSIIRVSPCNLDPLRNMADCGETQSCMHSELIRHERGLLNAHIDGIL